MTPSLLVIGWNGTCVRVRHDAPLLAEYRLGPSRLRWAFELASDVEGLRLMLLTSAGGRYRV